MKSVLLIGCGKIGFRHLEGAIAAGAESIRVVDQNVDVVRKNAEALQHSKLSLYSSMEDALNSGDAPTVVISALTSDAQEILFDSILRIPASAFLFEKPLSGNPQTLLHLQDQVKKQNAKAYVNCTRNAWSGYLQMRDFISRNRPQSFHFEVFGNLWGLGCNGVHFVESFRFLTSAKQLDVVSSQIQPSPFGNKRGEQFEEFIGTFSLKTEKGDTLQMTSGFSDPTPGGVRLIVAEKTKYQPAFLLDEQSNMLLNLSDSSSVSLGAQMVRDTTQLFLETVFKKETPSFPEISEVIPSHQVLIQAFALSLKRPSFRIT